MNNGFSDEKIKSAINLLLSSDALDCETAERLTDNKAEIEKAVTTLSKHELLLMLEALPREQKDKIRKIAETIK